MAIYAVGDIHGQLGLLEAAHALIAADIGRFGPGPVIHLGDLVDRGAHSRGVLDFLMSGMAEGHDWVVLKGNHDRMFTAFLRDPSLIDSGIRSGVNWLHPRVGGAPTLASYGVRNAAERPVMPVVEEAREAIPEAHLRFIDALPLTHRLGEALFVHAGIRPGIALEAQVEDDLVWIRDGFLDDPRDHGVLVVHGHTALDRARHYGNRVNIDSSAGYGGPVTAVAIEGRRVFLLTDAGREELTP